MARKKKRSRTADSQEFLDSRLFRLGTRLALALGVVVVFLTLAQCTIKKPESPQWTTVLTVPLINRTYPMDEIVQRIGDDGVQIEGDSNVTYTITEEVDTIRLDEAELSIADIDTTTSRSLGIIDIDAPSLAPVTIGFDQIASLPLGIVPPSSFTVVNDMAAITSFSTATIAGGRMYVVVDNNLGVDLDTVRVDLYDMAVPSSPALVGSEAFPSGIADGVTDSVLFILDGQTISNTLRISSTCHTPGGTVLTTADKDITTAVSFDGQLGLNSATDAEVPSLSLSDTTKVQLGADGTTVEIHHAAIQSGSLQIILTNNTPLAATVTCELPDLVSGGQPLQVQRLVQAVGTQVAILDISSYELVPSDLSAPQEVDLIFSAVTAGGRVDINQNQAFGVSTTLSSVSFASVTGIFSPKQVDVGSTQQDIDVPSGFDGFELATVVLTVRIENAVQLPGTLDVQLTGDNGRVLIINGPVAAGTADSSVTSFIINDSASSFLSPIPSQVTVTGTAQFADGVSTGTLQVGDFVHATLSFYAPLEMVVTGSTIETDIQDEQIDVDNIDLVTEHVERATFVYQITNSLPLGVTANVYLSRTSDVSPAGYDLDISDLSVGAAPHLGGVSIGSSEIVDTVVLTDEDVQILNTDSLYILTQLVLEDSGGQVVKLTPDNAITIMGRVEVEYLFDGSF
ncbi:MAG TPA: hypothetical protein VMY05_04205 [Acidobacteriota bacterium]|nr:hypothetical protein [Acidobacteriota bacterium]